MGCDIHARLEIKRYGTEWDAAYINVDDHLPRNYSIFGELAGVRSNTSVIPKGFPQDACWKTKEAYYCEVTVPDDDPRINCYIGGIKFVGERQATKNLRNGIEMIEMDGEQRFVGSDWHTPSWSCTKEVEEAIQKVEAQGDEIQTEWLMLSSLMKQYESNNYPCRLVYWFDS